MVKFGRAVFEIDRQINRHTYISLVTVHVDLFLMFLGYGQLLVLDESLSFQLVSSWYQWICTVCIVLSENKYDTIRFVVLATILIIVYMHAKGDKILIWQPDINLANLSLSLLITTFRTNGVDLTGLLGGHKGRLGEVPQKLKLFCETTHNICIKIQQTTVAVTLADILNNITSKILGGHVPPVP